PSVLTALVTPQDRERSAPGAPRWAGGSPPRPAREPPTPARRSRWRARPSRRPRAGSRPAAPWTRGTAPSSAHSSIWNALSWVRDLAFSVLIAVILIVFIYQPVKVEGTSMMPTLTDQERIFINKFTYHFGLGSIERGDMVVFWF